MIITHKKRNLKINATTNSSYKIHTLKCNNKTLRFLEKGCVSWLKLELPLLYLRKCYEVSDHDNYPLHFSFNYYPKCNSAHADNSFTKDDSISFVVISQKNV